MKIKYIIGIYIYYFMLSYFINNNIWVHCGTGNLKMIEYEPFNLKEKPEKVKGVKLSNVFNQFDTSLNHSEYPNKPINVIWFSRSDWITNTYYDNTTVDEKAEMESLNESEVFMIQNPKNILEIKTDMDMIGFCKIFNGKKLDKHSQKCFNIYDSMKNNKTTQTPLEKWCDKSKINFQDILTKINESINENIISDLDNVVINTLNKFSHFTSSDYIISYIFRLCIEFCFVEILSKYPYKYIRDTQFIDWNAVREEGYYGVSFDFPKVHTIGLKSSDYPWYSGFDVHSLCIWDIRAFDAIYAKKMFF